MWVHGAAIAGVVLGCAAWAAFQIWLEKRDPACRFRAGCCGGKGKDCKKASHQSSVISHQ
jgi:hypothetical protein